MAQGAATAIEDGAFLARCIEQVVQRRMDLSSAISIYEKGRMPKAYFKQQVSFLNGAIWHLPDGPAQQARDEAMRPELERKPFIRSPNLYGDPAMVLEVYGYDAEEHAAREIYEWLHGKPPMDERTGVTEEQEQRILGWFMPSENKCKQEKVEPKL